jgi:hypothetical protein
MWNKTNQFEIFLPSFGAYLPDVPKDLQAQNFYPIASRTPNGFDLDYSSLLLVDKIIIDSGSYDYIHQKCCPYLSPMKDTVNRLLDENLLRLVDYEAIAIKQNNAIRERVNILLETPEYWLSTARNHWKLYKKEIPELIYRYGDNVDHNLEKMHFGVYVALKNSGANVNSKEAEWLHKLLESRKNNLSNNEKDGLREIVRPLLSQIVFNHLLRVELGCPFIDWDDLTPYYMRIGNPLWSDKKSDDELLTKCQHIFTCVLPELKPSSINEVIKFIRKRSAVSSLKTEIRRSIKEGIQLDDIWARNIRDEANLAQITIRKRQRILSWVSLFAGVPIHNLPSAFEAAVSLGHELLPEAISSVVEKRGLKEFEWYYALLEVKNEK